MLCLLKALSPGNIFQDAHEHIPDKARRQRELDIGGNPEARGRGHLQPLRHAGTLHQHHFGLKGSSSRWRSTINSINASRTSSRFEWYTLNIIAPDYWLTGQCSRVICTRFATGLLIVTVMLTHLCLDVCIRLTCPRAGDGGAESWL